MKLLALAATLCVASLAWAQSETARQEAATRFERGVKLFEAQDYAAALAEFETAYRLVPRPQVLFNIGVTEKRLFRYNDAVRTLGQYLDDAGATVTPERRADVERELAEIRALVAEVSVAVPGPPAALELDGRVVGNSPLSGPLLVAPGQHTLRARRKGFVPAEETVSVVSGEKASVALTLVPVPTLPTTATLQLKSLPPGAALVVDGRDAGTAPWQGVLDPGGHELRATLPGYHATRQEVMLTAGQTRALTLELTPLPPPVRWYRRWYPWTIAAVVVVAAAGAGVGGWYATRPHYDFVLNAP